MGHLPFRLNAGLYEPGVDDFARLLRRLLPDGYTQEDESLFYFELECWAVMLAYLHEQRRRVLGNMSPRTTTELLDDWERAFSLAADAVRDVATRQQRLVAAESARGGATAERIANALAQIGSAAPIVVHPVTQTLIANAGLDVQSGELIYQLSATLSETDWTDVAVRHAAATLLSRMIPARSLGQDGAGVAESLATAVATWGDADSIVGRAYITDAAGNANQPIPPQRLRHYGPGSVIRARDINAIQDAVLRKPCTAAEGWEDALSGGPSIAFAVRVAGTAVAMIDAGDWRKRVGFLACRFAVQGTADIRPGQANDDAFSTSGTKYTAAVYWGVGNTAPLGSSSYCVTLASGVRIFADASNGKLYVENTNAGAYVLAGMLWCGPTKDDTAGALTNTRIVDAHDGVTFAAAPIDDAFFGALLDRSLLRAANGTGQDSWATHQGAGSRSVVSYHVNVTPGTILLDDTMDWRDRFVFCAHTACDTSVWGGVDTSSPGPIGADRHVDDDPSEVTTDRLFAPQNSADPSAEVAAIGYTGTGSASGGGSHGPMVELSDYLRLYVDSTTGALYLHRATTDANPPNTYLLWIDASSQTGKRSSPTALADIAVTDGDDVAAWQLNGIQDRTMLGVAPGSLALGTQLHEGVRTALPRIPEHQLSFERSIPQQRGAVGQARRFFHSFVAASGDVVIDSSIDWRDRFVRAATRRSVTLAIQPGEVDDTAANSTALVSASAVARYTGSGGRASVTGELDRGYHLVIVADVATVDTGLCIYADTSTGSLRLRNRTADGLSVYGWIDASFQLGFRTPS